ncbi:YdcF family protein [Sphingomonas oryzagri]|uniref:YdcF family protein n=1 Tax=Sphingomonas oryzagri TaxID=3042314 RepID=A0ABT6N484_9SPHN|nr:YdcF family protein [Sphingomonas oryzagri]MDH7640094.1 YdcF family protein [Sphingomonas oryzagri]
MIRRLIALLILLWGLGFAVFALTLPRPIGDRQTDAIVVLTGGAGRLDRGIDLLARHQAQRLFVSGTDRTVRKKELAVRTGRPVALFDCCVDLGKESVDTRSNATETAKWLEAHHYRSVRLITTDWHMPRAHSDLNRALKGYDVTVVPDAIRSQPGFMTLFTEYNKYVLRLVAAPFGY